MIVFSSTQTLNDHLFIFFFLIALSFVAVRLHTETLLNSLLQCDNNELKSIKTFHSLTWQSLYSLIGRAIFLSRKERCSSRLGRASLEISLIIKMQ